MGDKLGMCAHRALRPSRMLTSCACACQAHPLASLDVATCVLHVHGWLRVKCFECAWHVVWPLGSCLIRLAMRCHASRRSIPYKITSLPFFAQHNSCVRMFNPPCSMPRNWVSVHNPTSNFGGH